MNVGQRERRLELGRVQVQRRTQIQTRQVLERRLRVVQVLGQKPKQPEQEREKAVQVLRISLQRAVQVLLPLVSLAR